MVFSSLHSLYPEISISSRQYSRGASAVLRWGATIHTHDLRSNDSHLSSTKHFIPSRNHGYSHIEVTYDIWVSNLPKNLHDLPLTSPHPFRPSHSPPFATLPQNNRLGPALADVTAITRPSLRQFVGSCITLPTTSHL